MRRVRWLSLVFGLLTAAVLVWAASRSKGEASGPTLCEGAVALKYEVQSFHRLRVYMSRGGDRYAVHLRDDGKITVDYQSLARVHWDGQQLWWDSVGVGVDGPPVLYEHWAAALVPLLWQELRSGQVTWYARGPGYYGWSKDAQDWRSNVELVSSAWEGKDVHVFLEFGDYAKRLSGLHVRDSSGEFVFTMGIDRVDYDPPLPDAAFTPIVPRKPIQFPKLCGPFVCPDATPPAPPPPEGVTTQP